MENHGSEAKLGLRKFLTAASAGILASLLTWYYWGDSQANLASQAQGAELSIAPVDEPFSLPQTGSSLFDKIFSQSTGTGVRTYQIPYPFQKVLDRLREVSGVEPQVVLMPMGRSLQRNAAIKGLSEVKNLDPYYRYPRVVLGFDRESINPPNHLTVNVKGRLYLGLHERAQVIEAISYNDEAGRFEYQVVRDYGSGKPQVVYANRQVCLQCHQNQTPIFPADDWRETNANPAMQENILRVMRTNFPEVPCTGKMEPYCYRQVDDRTLHFYLGVPVEVDRSAPSGLDGQTKVGNYFHALHKMWQRICSDLECRRDLLKQIFLLKLAGPEALQNNPVVSEFNRKLQKAWEIQFPWGMLIPDSEIRARDPLVNLKDRGREDIDVLNGKGSKVKSILEQVLQNGNIPGEFEPLIPRAPSDTWNSALTSDGMLSRLVDGYAEFFTESDAQIIDELLIKAGAGSPREDLSSACKWKRLSGVRFKGTLICHAQNGRGLEFSAYLEAADTSSRISGESKNLDVYSSQPPCGGQTRQSCPQDLRLELVARPDQSFELSFRSYTGHSLRFFDGRRLSSVALPALQAGEEKSVTLDFALVKDSAKLEEALNRAFEAGAFKKFVDGPALNRMAVMTMVMGFLGQPNMELEILSRETKSMQRSTEAFDDELGELSLIPSERAVALSNHNCGACHYNREGAPPAYLGGPQMTLSSQQKCEMLAICTARMLYRLKMWDCVESDYRVKNTPMPPVGYMRAPNRNLEIWKAQDRKQLFESLQALYPRSTIQQYLEQQGLSRAESQAAADNLLVLGCPAMNGDLFAKLPHCDQPFLLPQNFCATSK